MCWEGGDPASACSHLAHSPLPPRGSRDPGMLWEQGEPAGGFLRPMVVGTLKPSITFVSLPSLQLAPSSLPGASHLVKLSLPDILNF